MSSANYAIDDLLSLLERSGWERYRAALVALVAERDELKAGVGRLWQILESAAVRSPVDQTIADALTALVAERDLLKRECNKRFDTVTIKDLLAERDALQAQVNALKTDTITALQKSVAELEASKPADRDRRIDLACSIYPILLSAAWSRATATTTPEQMAETHTALRDLAIVEADKMLVAMRKGEADGK